MYILESFKVRLDLKICADHHHDYETTSQAIGRVLIEQFLDVSVMRE